MLIILISTESEVSSLRDLLIFGAENIFPERARGISGVNQKLRSC